MGRKRIAVLLAGIDREYQRDFASALSSEGERLNVDVFLFNCQGHANHVIFTNDAGEGEIFDLPRMMPFDGMISLRETLANDLCRRKVEELLSLYAGKPHVSIDVPTNGAVNILFDDSGSIREITRHLIAHHGVRDIVYISGPRRQLVAMNRLTACREAMEQLGLVLEPENVFDGEWVQRRGMEIARELTKRPRGLPEAIICANDDMALGVIEALHAEGIRVPEDVIVTGFDALHEATLRGLTTARRPIDRAARTALEILSSWIDGKQPESWDIFLPTIPVYGSTCGCSADGETLSEKMWAMAGERRKLEETLTRVSMFSGALASAENERDAHLKIQEMARQWEMEEMYLCADPSLSREVPEAGGDRLWPEKMLLLFGMRNGETLPIRTFPTEQLLPVMEDGDRPPLCLVFCPLYYRDRNFGYVAMKVGAATGIALYSVLMLINGSLMSLYLQSNLRFYGRRMEEMTYTDPMTGLLNRRGLTERAPEALEQARRDRRCFVMLSSDMDHMKQINDRFGHQAGDEAIRRMGRAMESLERLGLTPVHISGDEFLSYGTADDPETGAEARRVLEEAMERINREEEWIAEIRASIGVYAAVPDAYVTLDDYQRLADNAMYDEKYRRRK